MVGDYDCNCASLLKSIFDSLSSMLSNFSRRWSWGANCSIMRVAELRSDSRVEIAFSMYSGLRLEEVGNGLGVCARRATPLRDGMRDSQRVGCSCKVDIEVCLRVEAVFWEFWREERRAGDLAECAAEA